MTKHLRPYKTAFAWMMNVLLIAWQIGQPLHAATFYWDADGSAAGNNVDGTSLGGSGTWDATTANWWDQTNDVVWPNLSDSDAVFTYAYVAGAPTLSTITLSGALTANQISFFRSGYTLTGGTSLTLAGTDAGLQANLGESATIASKISGSAGLLKTGGGSIRLSNAGNDYTGTTTIANGTIIIASQSALGAATDAVVVSDGNGTPSNVNTIGFFGGSLLLDGSSAGFTFSRNLDLSGQGPIGGRGSALLSIGDNTLSGTVTSSVSTLSPATFRGTRINSVNGMLTLSGTVAVQGTSASTFLSLGGVNTTGVGNFNLTGILSGSGSIEKSGAGTLFLNPSSTSGFLGTLRISSSATTGQQSSVRVTQATVGGTSIFGANTAATTGSAIDLNGGVLEFRSDSDLNFGALSSGKNVYNRSAGIIFTGPAGGGSAINGTTTFGVLQHIVSTTGSTATTTFQSRNGFGVTFSSMAIDASTSTSTLTNTLSNSLGGTLTFTGNITLGEGNTASRPRVLSFSGNGNTLVQGSVIAGTDNGKSMTKSGSGELTIVGTGTTVAGTISITGGAITATDFRSLNNNTAAISLGNATTTGGNLIIGGTGVTPTAAGLITSKTITLNTTSGSNSIYANQAGVNPVVLNGAITKIAAATTGALILGGTNTADNIINVVIPVETTPSTGGVTKIGAGTWVLNAANTYRGTTTIQNGTLKLRATAAASNVIGELSSNTIVFSANTTTGTAGGILEFKGFSGAVTTETLGALTPTAGAATVRLLGNGGSAANLTFTSLGATAAASSLNFDTSQANGGVITLTGQAATTATNLPGTANFLGHLYINGADFATIDGSAQVVAPTYTTGSGNFQNAISALIASVHNKLTGSFTNGAVTVSSLVTNSQTLTMSDNLTVSTGGILQSGGTASILSDSGTSREIRGGAAATNIAFRVDGSTDVLNIGSATNPIQLGLFTTGGLTKNGEGRLVFFGTNAQTGTTNINEGTVQLSGSSARISATSANLVIRQGALLELNGTTAANATVGALDGAGVITNVDAAAATFTQTGSGTWAGVFQDGTGVLNVTKAGTTGAPTWSGLNTYTGVTTIGGTTGSVTVDYLADGGQNSGIGASTSAAANLVFSGTTAGLIYRGSIIEGALTLGSRSTTTDRLFTLSGSGATLSSTVSNNNAIIWSNTGAIVHGTNADRTLIFDGTSTGDNTFNPQITDSTGFVTSVTKTGSGQWNLGSSNNTYTGVTTVNNGTLALNNNGAINTSSPIVLTPTSATSAAILQMSGIFDRSLNASPTAGSGGVNFGFSIASTTGGAGFAAHATELIVAIGGIGTPTALTWGSGGFVGTGGVQNLVLNSTSALSSVDFRNAIDLNGAARTINVLDNSNTGADYATMSGVLSGAGGGIIKIGSGILQVTGANTYTGTTEVQGGTLVVSSLGNSGDTLNTPNSVGVSGVAMGNTNAISLGAGGNNAGFLQYVGAGEISDRKIRFNSTTGTSSTNQIQADGSGPLILTNVANDMTAGAKTVALRGNNTAGNMITSQLSDNGGALSITVDGSATWILTNAANNYTGTTTVGAGALGIGHNTAIGSALTISNGNVFAYGGDRTLTNVLNLNANATNGWIGDYSLTFNGSNSLTGTGTSSLTINTYNSIAAGKTLTLNGITSAAGAARAWNFDGSGETVLNGTFDSGSFAVNIVKTGNGILTLGTNGATSNWNQAGNALDLDRGTLKFTVDNAIPTTTAANTGLTISPEVATTDTATVDLNGTTQTVNALTATTDGTVVIDNTSSTAATFRFGANDSVVNFGSGVGTYTITDSGTGALSIVKMGNTTATIPAGVNLTYQGSTESEGGGSFTIASAVNGTTALKVTGNSTLALTGGITSPGVITSIEVGAGSTLSLLDGAGSAISNLTTLNLGNTGAGTATLNLNVGTGATDTLTLLTTHSATLGNTITINMTDAGLAASTTYTLINLVDGGFTAFGTGNVIQGATPGGFTSMVWTVTDNLVQVTTGTLITGKSWWNAGGTLDNWNDVANWAITDKSGATPAASIPGQGTDVVFIADNITGGAAITTTLEQNFKINSLTFEASTAPADTPVSVTINPGALPTARLDIAPQLATDGIKITTGGPATVAITAAVKISKDQTWSVADAASVLSLGALFGEADVTQSGAGKITLTSAADNTFNSGVTADFTLTGGTLEMLDSTALGSASANNLANVSIGSGALFYLNNATSGTVANALTLNGGTLAAGGNNQTYSGTINLAADSTVSTRDLGVTVATTRTVTLSGVLSGAGKMTVNGNTAISAGNSYSGTVVLTQSNAAWTGGLLLQQGTIDMRQSDSLGTGAATVNLGRILFKGAVGTTWTEFANGLTLDNPGGNAVLELQPDAQGSISSVFTTDITGAITLGSATSLPYLRIYYADSLSALRLSGPITLGNNASIHTSGGGVTGYQSVLIDSVISDGGSGYGITFNGDTAWASNNYHTIRLTGANSFTGAVTVTAGTVEFTTVTNAGAGNSALGNGSALSLGTATLSFVGSSDQSTDRAITVTGTATLASNGTPGTKITYTGAITAAGNSINLTGPGEGFLTGGVTQTSTSADLNVNSGTWHLSGATNTLADDLFVNAASTGTAVLHLDSTGVLAYTTGTSNGLVAQNGGVINLGANDVNGVANSGGMDFILLGYSTVGATGVLNTNGYNITTPSLTLGDTTVGIEGSATGSGTITGLSTITLNRGSIAANLAGAGIISKNGAGTVTLSGDNSGLTSTSAAATVVQNGILNLDYTASNTTKFSTGGGLEMRGGTLELYGNNSAATSQTVNGFNLDGSASNDDSGASRIVLNPGTGQEIVFNLGAINRSNTNSDGTVRFVLPSGVQSATNGFTTSTSVTNGILGGSAFATVEDGSGTWFATKSGNNIVGLVSTVKNDVTTWVKGDHVSDGTTGFTGTLPYANISSLRFNASGGSTLTVDPTGILSVASGGILMTDAVTTGASTITGGTIASGVTELIFTQDSNRTLTVASDIRINQAVTKSGAGTLVLSGNNTYTDETNIFEGTLQVSGGNAIGDVSTVDLTTTRDTMFQLLSDETIGRLQGGSRLSGADYGTVDIGTHTLTINEIGSTTYSGFITGSGKLVMNAGNTGNLNLNNNSSGFTGDVVINGGLFQLSGIGQIYASSFTINKGGNLLIDNNSTTRLGTRILDTAAIIMNSADGAWSGQTRPRGLEIRTDQDGTLDETVGVITANSGANYVAMEATTSSDDSRIFASDIQRSNDATLNVRGTNLGGSSSQENELRITISANETAFIGTLVGGGGLAGTKNISIVPWAIGETYTGALGEGNMGNSLVTYAAGSGFRPLDFATEYNTLALAAATDNARESLSADLTGIAGTTVNALVLDNNNTAAVNVLGSGGGQALVNTSGTFLFTLSNGVASTTYTTTLGGFDSGISVGGTNEYVFFVNNPSSAGASPTLTSGATTNGSTTVTVASTTGLLAGMYVVGSGIPDGATVASVTNSTTFVLSAPASASGSGLTFASSTAPTLIASINSSLNSAADITKSGRGTLVLNQINTAGGGSNKTTLNEGTLEIADLDNIGGNTGALVFAGGTLRLGTGLTDDISSRTISFLLGGGTLDTNGIDLTLANSLGSGVGGFTKTGAGTLTLNAAASYTGGNTILGGTVVLGANNALGDGDLTVNNATLDVGAFNMNAGLVTVLGASPAINGTGTITSSEGFYIQSGTVSAALAGSVGLFKATASSATLSGANTFTGPVEVQAGTLIFNSVSNVGGGASALGNSDNAHDGVIRMGLTSAATTLSYTGAGNSTDRLIALQGTTGTTTLDADGTGALTLGGVRVYTAGTKTLTLQGSSAPAVVNTLGAINEDDLGTLSLNKTEANTWLLSAANTYSGTTTVSNGVLKIGVTDALPTATAVVLGSGTTAGTLDLNGFNQTIGSLSVQTNSASVTNQILVNSGNTLTINGAVTIGVDVEDSTTKLNALGGGAVVVNSGGGNFGVGAATGAENGTVDVDFSGLNTFTANLGTGTFRLGDPNTDTDVNPTTMKLAVNNTITAASIRIGDGSGGVANHTLTLGSGTNTLNADTINVGSASNTIRASGIVVFDGGDTTGTLTVRASDGTSRALLNMVNSTGSTSGDMASTINLSGHTADVLVSTLTMANRTTNSGAGTATLTFDQGTLDVTTLNMASRTGAGTGNATATVNLGDSAAPGSPTTTIGTLNMAVNTSAGGTVTADFNVTGGTVTIGTGSGTAINMANAGTGRTVTSTLDLTGGSVSVTGNIVRTGGAGTENATVTLDGSTLAMNGNSIGDATNTVTFNAQSGTLTGLAELNGGGLLTKSTTGTLTMGNGNTYTGGTSVTAGTLEVVNTTGSGTGTGAVTVGTTAVLSGSGSIAGTTTIAAGGVLAPGVGNTATSNQTMTFSATTTSLSVADTGAIQLGLTTADSTDSAFATWFQNNPGGTAAQYVTSVGGIGNTTWNTGHTGDHDFITAAGTVVLGSSPTMDKRVVVSLNNATGLNYGSVFNLLDWTTASTLDGTSLSTMSSSNFDVLNNVQLDTLSGGLGWDTSLFDSYGILVVVPEPSRALLLLLGLVGLMLRRRRR